MQPEMGLGFFTQDGIKTNMLLWKFLEKGCSIVALPLT